MLNFWEHNYGDFEVSNNYTKNGFFYVQNSTWNIKQYDPLNRLNLDHFLIVGYDSYLEVLANKEFKLNYLVN